MQTMNTIGLPEDTKGWVDNIYMNTTIAGTQKKMYEIAQNGIKLYITNSIEE